LNQFRTSFDKSQSVFTDISAGISGIFKNQISRCLPVFFSKREKKSLHSTSRELFRHAATFLPPPHKLMANRIG
jgi:hypothetical protein